jgi:hypothetical protein
MFTWFNQTRDLVEGVYADQYTDSQVRQQIAQSYTQRHCRAETPATHPWLFDPLTPPQGWRYDPYYELWIQST